MKHDPERSAAMYLAGEMSKRLREAFERHILRCEDCWREVDLGRTGRATAEAAREMAPQALRERVRMTVAAMSPPVPWWRRSVTYLGALLVVIAVAGGTFLLVRSDQPREIAVLVADFTGETELGAAARATLPSKLGDLKLASAEIGTVGGVEVTAHVYRDQAGHQVTVYQSDREFPIARGARHDATDSWTAEIDGVVLYCADEPVPSLVIGDDPAEVALAASELRLR